MNAAARRIRNRYLLLSQFIWLPTSLIVGVNTLFLLDGGLTNVEAFTANAIYTLGLVVFEIPTGMIADTWGRRTSYLLGAAIQRTVLGLGRCVVLARRSQRPCNGTHPACQQSCAADYQRSTRAHGETAGCRSR